MRAAFLLLATLLPCMAWACDGLRAADAWIRLPPPGADTAAGYFELVNAGAAAITVTGISSPAFAHAMMHETRYEHGHAVMRHLDTVTLAPGATRTFAPGGTHLMLVGPRAPLEAGRTIELHLHCAGGGALVTSALTARRAPY